MRPKSNIRDPSRTLPWTPPSHLLIAGDSRMSAHVTFSSRIVFAAVLLAAGAVHAQTLDGRMKKIADTKSISVAYRTDASPFSFVSGGQPDGFSIDICKRVVSSIERQLKVQSLKVNWVPVTVQTRFDT